jgi:hypothetical protein
MMANSTPPTPATKRPKLCFDERDPSITPLSIPANRPACGRRLDFGGPSNFPVLDNIPEKCVPDRDLLSLRCVSTPDEKSWERFMQGQFEYSVPTQTPIPHSSVSRRLVYEDTPPVEVLKKTVKMGVAGICRLPPSPEKEKRGKKK